MKFLILMAALFATPNLRAQGAFPTIPLMYDDPEVTRVFDPKLYDFFGNLLDSARIATHLECELNVSKRREVRKFSEGTEWIEYLDVTLSSNAPISNNKISAKFPMSSKYGLKKVNNPWSGVGEHVKISAGDYLNHILNFIHDGQGQLVYLVMSNDLKVVPCKTRDNRR